MKDTLREVRDDARFRVSTDIVVFTVRRDRLEVLLCRQETASNERGVWSLPGGFVADGEPLDASARRALAEHTGLADIYLEQLFTFGQPERHPGPRVISVAYFALVPGDRLTGFDSGRTGTWWDAARLPPLYLDHEQIIDTARERLAAKLEYSTIAFQLMPDRFTLSELQGVYETIYDRPVDKRNFRKRVLALEHVQATDHKRRNGFHRPARLYRYTARDAIEILK
ncbi:MAG: NUDIX domain-containing protein [Gammaproteobacteria bacterium]|nr:NUDIX domain-containing protein [Gammaproteobacteria bacterium]